MQPPTLELHVEAEQLRQRIDLLAQENLTLRELAAPSAGPVELQAENIILKREAAELAELVPHLVPYRGPLPETMAALEAMPDPHRRQINTEHPEHVESLAQVEELLRRAADEDARAGRQGAALEGAEASSAAAFAALDPDRRLDVALNMTPAQRRAMCGDLPVADEAYL